MSIFEVDFKTAPNREDAYAFMRKFIAENPDALTSVFFEEALKKNGFQMATIYPGKSGSYGLKKRNPHVIVIDDGSVTHKRSGTVLGPQAFDTKQLGALFRRAKSVIVNACTADRWVGENIIGAAKEVGLSILIETEGESAWADWARIVFAKRTKGTPVLLRIPPDTIIPDDLVGKVNHDWLKSQSTVH